MDRIFYKNLVAWKAGGCFKPLLVTGARQVGKTYLIDQFCSHEFLYYKQINLLDDPLFAQIFDSELNAEEKLKQMYLRVGIPLDSPQSILFVDEVQESERFISYLKYLHEVHPEINIVCAGSLLGVRLKRFQKSFPVGKVQIRTLYPLSFEEFLQAIGKEDLIQEIVNHYQSNAKMFPALHQELMLLCKTYCCIGGMPEAVLQYLEVDGQLVKFDANFFEDLRKAYIDDMKKYVDSGAESLKIERIYQSIPSQLGNNSARFQYSKTARGARSAHYASALDWLLSAGLVHKTTMVENPEKPLNYFADNSVFKLYLSDVGIFLHALGVSYEDFLFDTLKQVKGIIIENYLACEMIAKGIPLHYWRSSNSAEIDFLLEKSEGVIPVEAKAADNVHAKSLNTYRNKYSPEYSIRVSAKNFGFENNIKSVPHYASFCLNLPAQ